MMMIEDGRHGLTAAIPTREMQTGPAETMKDRRKTQRQIDLPSLPVSTQTNWISSSLVACLSLVQGKTVDGIKLVEEAQRRSGVLTVQGDDDKAWRKVIG